MSAATCHELIAELRQASSVAEVQKLCELICDRYGFEHFAYVARIPVSLVKPYICYLSGFPASWSDQYLSNGYMQIDPVVQHCMTHITPLTWDTVSPGTKKDDPRIWQFMGEAKECGLKSGLSIPVHGTRGDSALLSLTSGEPPGKADKRIQHVLPEVHLLSAYLHEAMFRLVAEETVDLAEVDLTEREKACLLWASDGKTSWETAQILGIAERTVIFHLRNAAKKLNVVNRQQAIAKAVSLGFIAPQFG